VSSKLPHVRSVVKRKDRPRRDEQVATLQAKLHDPSTPDSVKPSLEAAITRIAYRPRRMEVTR
jgi:hypothetical protein